MDEIIELTNKLKEELFKLPEVKEYFKNKALFENDEELKKMRLEIARLQNEGKKQEHDNLLKIYSAHPLVNNFEASKEEVKTILNTLKDIIQ